MVLPLIPLALIAVGAVTGGGGVVAVGNGALNIKRAQDEVRSTKDRYAKRRAKSEEAITDTNKLIADYRSLQERAFTEVVVRMRDFLIRHARQIAGREDLLIDELDAGITCIVGVDGIQVDAARWVAGVLGALVTGAGTNAAVTGTVAAFGTASTGTAIASLSGAAAESATMAALGGGSIAAGGGGVALGSVALGAVALGPALLVGGLTAHIKGNKDRTHARKQTARVEVEIAKMDAFDTTLSAVNSRVSELSGILTTLSGHAVDALDVLESEPFDPAVHAEGFQNAVLLAKSVAEVVQTALINENGDLTDESYTLTIKYRVVEPDQNKKPKAVEPDQDKKPKDSEGEPTKPRSGGKADGRSQRGGGAKRK